MPNLLRQAYLIINQTVPYPQFAGMALFQPLMWRSTCSEAWILGYDSAQGAHLCESTKKVKITKKVKDSP